MSGTTLLTGGRVHALDATTPPGEALVVRDGRVLASGSAREMATIAGRAAERVELRGATVLPGLIDTHPHLLHFGAFTEPLVDIADARSHDDIVARVRARAATTPAGEWIMTTPVGEPHYFLRRSWRDLAEGVLPDRHVLDRATTAHPVFIQAWAPVIPNVCAFNTAGLARLGIDRDTPDRVQHVWIEKAADGDPTGILRGSVNNYYTNVFEHVALAETHRFCGSGRENRGPAQPVSRMEALAMWTRDAAHVLRWDGIGTLRPGDHADLIVVDRDPLDCDLDALPATQVLRTVVGGRTVHDTGAL